ncbi:unnamed protein product [Rhizoctonia solani]|uniref:Uncharacterized protein n=1 Tax=Rhizoctonia solani TaxID=456999 RepID=A0A8H2W6L4_9AGAM|nr:unnamed protein product [Rhizoctonia solani]
MSALFHTAVCHSPNVGSNESALSTLLIEVDTLIVVSVGTFYPTLHYGFFCDYYLKFTYIILITVGGSGKFCTYPSRTNYIITAPASAYVVLKPDYATPAYRWARALVFYALGVVALVPLVHAYFAYGLERMQDEMGFHWLLSCICFYVVGGMIYGCRIPERWMPGTFDYFGASHQILHVCVVLAMLSNYKVCSQSHPYFPSQSNINTGDVDWNGILA